MDQDFKLVLRLAEPTPPSQPLELAQAGYLGSIQVAWPALSQFDRLLSAKGKVSSAARGGEK